ncbi:MAG: DUF3473 domain-containing protein [Phycisphaerae bacterium]|nr:DUF3473 domain-containing protein [Phycisphaerae bacterium]
MINALTIDVEDANNLFSRQTVGVEMKPTCRVVENTDRLLELLSEHQTTATWFVLGEVAAAFPELVRNIASGGHELGVHGFYHYPVFRLSPEGFRKEIRDGKARIEDIAGTAVRGHRAPAFSVAPRATWALQVLAEEGFAYDSSIFPFAGRRYGWAGSPVGAYIVETSAGTILEIPPSVLEIGGRRWPVAGGGYLRLFAYWWTRWAMRRIERQRPVVVYLHPYEFETASGLAKYPPMPWHRRVPIQCRGWLFRRGRRTVWLKLRRLLNDFRFGSIREVFLNGASDCPRRLLQELPGSEYEAARA